MDMTAAERFERELVKVIIDEVNRQGMNFAQFARRAYGDNEAAIVKWRTQRRKSKPQQLSTHDIFLLAEALNTDLAYLVFRAQAQLQMEH